MQHRKEIALDSLVFVAAVALNVILLNVIGTRVSVRADLTRDDLFTLSPGSVNILAGLEDDLTVKVYFSRDLEPPFNRLPRFLTDKLDEYKAAAKGKLRYEVLYPEDDEKLRKEAQDQGLVQGQLQVIKADKLDVRKAYMGLAMFYGNQKEVIPWLPEGHKRMEPIYEYMEYNLSARIKKLLRGGSKKRKVAFLSGHDEPGIARELKRASEVLREADYEVTTADLSGDKTLPADLDVLIVAGPKKKLTDRERWEIDQHLMRGKPVAFFLDAVSLQPQRGMVLGSPNEDNLKDLIAHYGVKMQPALALDERCIPVPVPSHQRIGNLVIQGQVFKPYPPILAVGGITGHPMARGVAAKRFILPFVAPLEPVEANLADKEVVELAWSSPNSWKMDGSFFLLNPTQDFTSPWRRKLEEALIKARETGDESGLEAAEKEAEKLRDEKGPPRNKDGRPGFSLAYALHGKFKSFFAGKPLPEGVKAGSSTTPETAEKTQILVLGSSFFLHDNFFAPGNQLFLQNAIDWLLQDADLMMIRARTFASPPLESIEGAAKETVRFANVLGVPLALVGLGLVRWVWRRRRKATVSL
jgi:ABC-type uncharacterized transport system involved in gliding motility auxiliary subunit